jgi:Zn-dependent protease with chaperone function
MSSHGPSGDLPNIRKLRIVKSRKSASAVKRGPLSLGAAITKLKQKWKNLLGLPTDGRRLSTVVVLKTFLSLVLLSTLSILFVTILAVLLLMLGGCGTNKYGFTLKGDDEKNPTELVKHYESFLTEARAREIPEIFVLPVTMYFTNISNKNKPNGNVTAAFCVYDTQEVYVDRTIWAMLDSGEREALMFHEFGHCSLFRGHNETCYRKAITGKCFESLSLMYPQLNAISVALEERREEVLNELFSHAAPVPHTTGHENCNH